MKRFRTFRYKHLLYILRQMLSATIKMPDGTFVRPNKGTPQGGIISPLLANIVLNELDHWIDSQWQDSPVKHKYSKCNGYVPMRKTGLKEMYIVRYADDFRIFCRNKTDAERTKAAVTQWLSERLRLDVSPEKTRVVNIKRRYSVFLGFKIRVHPKGQKLVVKSHINDKQLKHVQEKLVKQAKRIGNPRRGRKTQEEISLYNSMVMGIQNYYRIATNVNLDCSVLHRAVMKTLTNRLRTENGSNLVKAGRELTQVERKLYGKSKMLRFVAGTDEPAYLRKMALDGYCIRLDLGDLKKVVSLMRYASNNLNQYAKKANETGGIYLEDIQDLKIRFEQIWSELKEIHIRLASIE